MNLGPLQDNSPRLPLTALLLLAALYLLAGVTGHDPWKTEDAIHLGIAHSFLHDGDWLFPHVGGEAWPHTAPLYHWVAAALGGLLDGLLPFHDAARLATPLFGSGYLIFIALAAHSLHGEAAGGHAPLLSIGTLGLLLPLHEAQPAVAGLACAALAWWGGGLLGNGRKVGSIPLGLGLGLAFPAHGLVGLIMAIAVLPAPILRGDWKSLAIALLIALPLGAAWPLAVSGQAPHLWAQWWANEIAEATIGRDLPVIHHFEQLLWLTWPVLPIALWSLWLHRHRIGGLALPLLGCVICLGWYFSGPSRSLSVLPLMIPFTLLAAAGAHRLRRGAANAFDWFALMTFSFVAGLVWLGASAQALDWPPRIARNFDKLAPGHEVHFSALALVSAAALTFGWFAVWRLPRANWRASLHWAAGTTLMWALVSTLWFSWIDHGKSYRSVVLALRAALPPQVDCIERSGVGTSQRASLDYFAGIRTVPPTRQRDCGWRLSINDRGRATPVGWIEVWQGARPGDRDERWYLDRRAD